MSKEMFNEFNFREEIELMRLDYKMRQKQSFEEGIENGLEGFRNKQEDEKQGYFQ